MNTDTKYELTHPKDEPKTVEEQPTPAPKRKRREKKEKVKF